MYVCMWVDVGVWCVWVCMCGFGVSVSVLWVDVGCGCACGRVHVCVCGCVGGEWGSYECVSVHVHWCVGGVKLGGGWGHSS